MNDFSGIVEACYDTTGSEEQWLARLASAAHPWLDGGFGVLASSYRADGGSPRPVIRSTVLEKMRPEVAEALWRAGEVEDPSVVARAMSQPVASARSTFGMDYETCSRGRFHVEPLGILDSMVVSARHEDGTGVTLAAPLAAPRTLTPSLVRRWTRVAAHIAAGLRLRLITPSEEHEDLDAECRASEPAQAEALGPSTRLALRQAAVAMDQARGPKRVTDPSQAIEAWRGLVEGSYTLVDHFDRGGRHYLVARVSASRESLSTSLTARERQVVAFRSAGHPLKLIAYELGLSVATVSRTLTTAMRKLGVRTHVELARALGSTGT